MDTVKFFFGHHREGIFFGYREDEVFYRTQVNLGSDLWVRLSVPATPFGDLTDVTLADEDTKSIPTDNAKRAIKGNVAMHVRQPGG